MLASSFGDLPLIYTTLHGAQGKPRRRRPPQIVRTPPLVTAVPPPLQLKRRRREVLLSSSSSKSPVIDTFKATQPDVARVRRIGLRSLPLNYVLAPLAAIYRCRRLRPAFQILRGNIRALFAARRAVEALVRSRLFCQAFVRMRQESAAAAAAARARQSYAVASFAKKFLAASWCCARFAGALAERHTAVCLEWKQRLALTRQCAAARVSALFRGRAARLFVRDRLFAALRNEIRACCGGAMPRSHLYRALKFAVVDDDDDDDDDATLANALVVAGVPALEAWACARLVLAAGVTQLFADYKGTAAPLPPAPVLRAAILATQRLRDQRAARGAACRAQHAAMMGERVAMRDADLYGRAAGRLVTTRTKLHT